MEKTFVDWYLLQVEETNEYTAKILAYMDRFTFIDELNAIEVCLLVDTCLSKGNTQQKNDAQVLALRLVEESNRDAKKEKPVEKNRIFDKVLSLSGLDKEQDLKDMEDQDQEKESDEEDSQ